MKGVRMFQLAVSPCSNPDLTLDQALAAYAGLGFTRFELFTSWCQSAADISAGASQPLTLARAHGFSYSSIHLPPLAQSVGQSLEHALSACKLGVELGCRVAIVKGDSPDSLVRGAGPLRDAIDDLPIIPVLQNHAGSAISTLDDYRRVLEGIADPRIKCTLEVGHFHTVGVPWQEGYEALAGRIELVHIKDQIGPQSVPFGTGEVDIAGLIERLVADGYEGDVVIEMEVEDPQNTLEYLRQAREYVLALLGEWAEPAT